MRNLFRCLAVLVLLAAASACAPSPPYVFVDREFDRGREGFGQDPTDISSVTICYNKRGTTPQEVARMAQQQCARFNKNAVFVNQDYKTCPLDTPVAANYNCVAP